MNYLQKKKLAFMSIVNSVKGFVRTISGKFPLTLPYCVDNKSITDYKIYGNSVQNGTPSPTNYVEVESVGDKTKNLIEYPYEETTKTLNGLTFIDNGDGTISVNGIAEANTTFNIRNSKSSIWAGIIPNETYTASVIIEGGYTGSISYVCNYYPEGSTSYDNWMSATHGKVKTATCPTDIVGIRSYIYIPKGVVANNIVIKPQVEAGEVATEYEPYGYKIPVTVSGKNLCPNDWERGNINIDTGVNQTSSYYIRTKDYFVLDKNRVYYISSDDLSDTETISWYFYDENKEFIKRTASRKNRVVGEAFSIPSNASFYRLAINQNEIDTNIKVQIEEGDVKTDYEPYHEPITTNIFLDKPLRNGECISYKENKLPEIPTFKGTTILTVGTTTQPSNADITYFSTQKGD